MKASKDAFQILVVDDSPVSRKLVEQALVPEPCSVLFAASGEEALRLFGANRPALVITDWMMPDLSGVEVCRRIRAQFRESYPYIIMLTGVAKKDNVIQGLAAGADDYLTKPFHSGELLARIGVGRRFVELQREIQAKNQLLQELARTDSLTGLPNRRAVEEWGVKELRGAARHGYPAWAVLIDVDCFKKLNDTYGHDAGDGVLKTFGVILRETVRASDICGRWGGEEFALVLTHVSQENLGVVLERIRRQFEEHRFSFEGHHACITASFGAAGFQGKEIPNFLGLIAQADKALYAAKRGGKNQIQIEGLQPV
ncbi:MAG TPA: diguanylate cyclase [Methylomirabilota bacterium]|jgi:diguanylate cyclase (GGDEF)-like protein|nr:diguanylate cyclase [Methylomirabilota bacterium]